MASLTDPTASLAWLAELGIDFHDLNPCVPGEFTLSNTYYVNTATANIVYVGAGEGTLPMVPGRWFLIPGTMTSKIPRLIQGAVPVSRAVVLTRST